MLINMKKSNPDLNIPGVKIFSKTIHKDERGGFMELSRDNELLDEKKFVQDNISYSKKNVLRGMHYQVSSPYAQLITVISGKVFDVLLDLRKESPTYKKALSLVLGDDFNQVYMPEGVAHGFLAITDNVIMSYKCSEYYIPGDEGGVLWSSLLDVSWPVTNNLIINKRDKNFSPLENIKDDKLPRVIIRTCDEQY